jgi:hypothetical protein
MTKKPADKATKDDPSSTSSLRNDDKDGNKKVTTTPGAVPSSSSQAGKTTRKNKNNRRRKQSTAKMDRGVQLAPGNFEEEESSWSPPPPPPPSKNEPHRKDSGLQLAPALPAEEDDTFLGAENQKLRGRRIVQSEGTTSTATTTAVSTTRELEPGERRRDDEENENDNSEEDDIETPLDAFVVPERPTTADRLSSLYQLSLYAPLAEVIQPNSDKTEDDVGNNENVPRRKTYLVVGAILLLLVVVSAIVTVSLTVWNSEEDEDDSSFVPVLSAHPTLVASGAPKEASITFVPSAYPTLTASGVPSMAPTTPAPTSDAFGIMASRLFANLEQDRPRDRTSPQWKAIQWLVEEDGFFKNSSEPVSSSLTEYQLSRRYALATLYFATNGEE